MARKPTKQAKQVRVQADLTRRQTLTGLGAMVGTAALAGCGKPDDATTDGGTSGTSAGSGSEGTETTVTETTSSESGGSDTDTGADTDGEPQLTVCEGSELSPEALLAGIDHIVVVMMENRSFDHYFGALSLEEGHPVDGLTGGEQNPTTGGEPIGVHNLDHFVTEEDPPHSWNRSRTQWNEGLNDGFVRAYEDGGATGLDEVMGYYVRDQLATFYQLADQYVVCDRWFCSVMGPTWPNRFYLHLGTSDGQQGNDEVSGLPSIFDRLADAGVSHRYYYSGLPFPLVYGTLFDSPHMVGIEEFFADAQDGNLPGFCMVEPVLTALNTIGNDDHPPADVAEGQAFIASVYHALAQSPNWERTLLIITYDEHGGFYDHVSPPETYDALPDFRQLGFRVPSLVVGPQVRKGCINNQVFDHTSVLATVTKRFGLEPLNERVAMATDLSSCIDPSLVGRARPPIRLPAVTLPRTRKVVVPGANFGGQDALAAVCERLDPAGPDGWRLRSEAAMAVIRRQGRRLGAIRVRG